MKVRKIYADWHEMDSSFGAHWNWYMETSSGLLQCHKIYKTARGARAAARRFCAKMGWEIEG